MRLARRRQAERGVSAGALEIYDSCGHSRKGGAFSVFFEAFLGRLGRALGRSRALGGSRWKPSKAYRGKVVTSRDVVLPLSAFWVVPRTLQNRHITYMTIILGRSGNFLRRSRGSQHRKTPRPGPQGEGVGGGVNPF